jgi:hypothetical protein
MSRNFIISSCKDFCSESFSVNSFGAIGKFMRFTVLPAILSFVASYGEGVTLDAKRLSIFLIAILRFVSYDNQSHTEQPRQTPTVEKGLRSIIVVWKVP